MIALAVFIIFSDITAFVVLVRLTWQLWNNSQFLTWVHNQKSLAEKASLVSVLVPARNESANITACIESLLKQTYTNLEIIALNDQSTDDTGSQLDQVALHHPKLTVIHSNVEPPPGWNGKSFACYQLSQKAAGEWLLFTDADTIHTSKSITLGIAQAEALEVDFLSALPHQATKTWSEHLTVPFIIDFLPLVGWDFKRIWQGRAQQVAANGQYLLVRSETYHALGGHRAIQSALVDDFALAHLFHYSGHHIALVNGTAMLTCRMYHTSREVWHGFSKNIVLALSETTTTQPPLWKALLFGWGYASVFVTPYILLFLPGAPLAFVFIIWAWLLYATASKLLRQSFWQVPFILLSAISVIALSLNALYRRWRAKTVTWKGRIYR